MILRSQFLIPDRREEDGFNEAYHAKIQHHCAALVSRLPVEELAMLFKIREELQETGMGGKSIMVTITHQWGDDENT
mgnify:CR=1 FL=1|jgi:hypothetical protein